VCFLFQERLHYETLSQHLGKLGEDAGKMVHRVIDLTRPEDLDGERRRRLLLLFFPSSSPLPLWKLIIRKKRSESSRAWRARRNIKGRS